MHALVINILTHDRCILGVVEPVFWFFSRRMKPSTSNARYRSTTIVNKDIGFGWLLLKDFTMITEDKWCLIIRLDTFVSPLARYNGVLFMYFDNSVGRSVAGFG